MERGTTSAVGERQPQDSSEAKKIVVRRVVLRCGDCGDDVVAAGIMVVQGSGGDVQVWRDTGKKKSCSTWKIKPKPLAGLV